MNVNPLGIIFSDTQDDNLQELTCGRTTASIPFGGRYRLIDFTLSNMVNSGVKKIGVITRSNYQSLINHINTGKEWDLSHKREGLYILPPFGRERSGMYKDRLEALYGILDFIRSSNNDYVILSDCDVVANQDFREPLEYHIKKGADLTVVYRKTFVESYSAKNMFTFSFDEEGRIKEVRNNPENTGELSIGMNVWIVGKRFLERIISECYSRGLGSWEYFVMQKGFSRHNIYGWEFKGYAGQIGSMGDYYRVSMDMLDSNVREELFYKFGHIFTKVRDDVPTKYSENADVKDSCIADGSIIEGTVEHSIIFRDARIGKGSHISNSIIMQGTYIGNNVTLNSVIVDKDVRINDNRTMMGFESCPIHIKKASVI